MCLPSFYLTLHDITTLDELSEGSSHHTCISFGIQILEVWKLGHGEERGGHEHGEERNANKHDCLVHSI